MSELKIMDNQRAKALLQRYYNNECSAVEKLLVEAWYKRLEESGELHLSEIENEFWKKNIKVKLLEEISEKHNPIIQPHKTVRVRTQIMGVKWLVAASIIFAIFFSVIYLNNSSPTTTDKVASNEPNTLLDVPAPEHAIPKILLSNGQSILLDSTFTGSFAELENVEIQKEKEGEIIYKARNDASTDDLQYNTLIVPRGSKIVSIKLADGTKVWLNSESSLRYPIAFSKTERKVSVSGEAYFEVAKDLSRKFFVQSDAMSIEVTGTHFNVNSYSGESFNNVTLLEGSVKVSHNGESAVLKPGQQIGSSETGLLTLQNKVDLEQILAWKNGLFSFRDADLLTVFRQISRWYDVEIKFSGEVPKGNFTGEIGKELNLSQVLRLLGEARVHYKMTSAKSVTIYP